MSTTQNTPEVKIFNLIHEAIKLLAQTLSGPLVYLLLLSFAGLIVTDILAFILKSIIHLFTIIEVFQWLLKFGIVIVTAWATIYWLRLPGADRSSITIKDLLLAVKNSLPRIMKTLGALISRFSGLIIAAMVTGLMALVTRTPEILFIISPIISGWAIYLFVGYIFWLYLIFDNGLKPAEIPAYSTELAIGHRWKIFFTMITNGILIGIISVPLFLLYPSMLESDRYSAVANFAVDLFRDPVLFVLFYYILLIFAVVFQTLVFFKFYNRIKAAEG